MWKNLHGIWWSSPAPATLHIAVMKLFSTAGGGAGAGREVVPSIAGSSRGTNRLYDERKTFRIFYRIVGNENL